MTDTQLATIETINPAAVADLVSRIPSPDTAALRETFDRAKAITTVVSDNDYTIAMQVRNGVTTSVGAVEANYKPYKDAAHKLHKAICDLEKKYIAPLGVEKARLNTLGLAYQARKEAEAREAARIERERIEAERRAQQAEADLRAQEEAARLEADGKADEATAVIEDRIAEAEDEAKIMTPEIIAPVNIPSYRESGAKTVVTYKAVCVDKLALIRAAATNPEAYADLLIVDGSALNARARSQREAFAVPGCEVVAEKSLR